MAFDKDTTPEDPTKKESFMDKLRGGTPSREGIREGAKMMALFMEEFTAAGFTRPEVLELIKGMMAQGMQTRKKPVGTDPKEGLDTGVPY